MTRVLPFIALAAGLVAAAFSAPASAGKDSPESHPLKGVIVDVLPDRQALLVKHEEIPGVMRAMTMLLKVEPAVLERVKKGDAIEARLSRRDDGWWLHEVRVVPKPG